MSIDRTLAVAERVLQQLRRDHRSIAIVIIAPSLLLWLLSITFENVPGVFDRIAPMLLGTFPFTLIFLVTSVTMLRERNQGTLDRMLVSPIGRGDIMVGYALAFSVLAAVQSAVTLFVTVYLLDVNVRGNLLASFFIVLCIALYGTALGLTLSAFAQTEFQAVQFMPIFLLPQVFLSGLLVPVEKMPGWMEWIAKINPLQYVFELLTNVMSHGTALLDSNNLTNVMVAIIVPIAVLVFGAATMRRQSNA